MRPRLSRFIYETLIVGMLSSNNPLFILLHFSPKHGDFIAILLGVKITVSYSLYCFK